MNIKGIIYERKIKAICNKRFGEYPTAVLRCNTANLSLKIGVKKENLNKRIDLV